MTDDRKILVHHHERYPIYPMGAPAMRGACGETAYRQEHQIAFDWDKVTCPACLAVKEGEAGEGGVPSQVMPSSALRELVVALASRISVDDRSLREHAEQVVFELDRMFVMLESASKRSDEARQTIGGLRLGLEKTLVRLRSCTAFIASESLDVDPENRSDMETFIGEMETLVKKG